MRLHSRVLYLHERQRLRACALPLVRRQLCGGKRLPAGAECTGLGGTGGWCRGWCLGRRPLGRAGRRVLGSVVRRRLLGSVVRTAGCGP